MNVTGMNNVYVYVHNNGTLLWGTSGTYGSSFMYTRINRHNVSYFQDVFIDQIWWRRINNPDFRNV